MNHPHDNNDVTIPSPVSEDNLNEAGIRVGEKGFYDPERGARKVKTERPVLEPGPLLATDPGQPGNIEAKGITRERKNGSLSPLDNRERPVVDSKDSKPSGRKATQPKE